MSSLRYTVAFILLRIILTELDREIAGLGCDLAPVPGSPRRVTERRLGPRRTGGKRCRGSDSQRCRLSTLSHNIYLLLRNIHLSGILHDDVGGVTAQVP